MSTISLAPLCEVEMIGGQANEAITVGTSASFSLISTLDIEVLDKGLPVEGATIIVDGQTVQTDALGSATAQTTARTVDAQGDVQEGTKTVTMQIGSFTEFSLGMFNNPLRTPSWPPPFRLEQSLLG